MVTKTNAERNSCEKANDVNDVSDVRIVTRYSTLFGDHDDVVDEIDDGHQSLGREEKPGKLERAHKHHAGREGEDCGRGAQHSRSMGHKGLAEDEAYNSARKKDHQMLGRANSFLQRVSEDEKKEHVPEQVQDISVNKQCRDKSPDSALLEIVKSEDKILFGKHRGLLPGPNASPDASEYQQRIGSQRILSAQFSWILPTSSSGQTVSRGDAA